MSKNRTYYTLRTGQFPRETIFPDEFDTYEEAFDALVNLYLETKDSGDPVRCGIYRTQVSEWNGSVNTMTRPVWSK